MKKENIIMIMVGLILLVLIAGGIYFFMNEQIKSQKTDYEKQITTLNSQIKEKDKKISESDLMIKTCEETFKTMSTTILPPGLNIPSMPTAP